MLLIMSRDEDDQIQATLARAAGTDAPPLLLSGLARHQIAEAIRVSIAAHERAEAATKVGFERQRHRAAVDHLERALGLLRMDAEDTP